MVEHLTATDRAARIRTPSRRLDRRERITVLRLLLIPFFFSVLLSDRADSACVRALRSCGVDRLARRDDRPPHRHRDHHRQTIDPLVDRLLIASGVIGLYLIGQDTDMARRILVARDAICCGERIV
jgi:hypothetical protein